MNNSTNDSSEDFFSAARLAKMIRSGLHDPRRLARALGRTAGAFATTAAMATPCAVEVAWRGDSDLTTGARWMRRYCARMVRLFDVRITTSGERPPDPSLALNGGRTRKPGALLICNHRSYFDIPVVGSLAPIVFVSRGDLLDWPVIGYGGKVVGTIFVNRHDPYSRERTREQILATLGRGLNVLNFPEGQTYEDVPLGPFHPGLFRTVAGQALDIIPVTVSYQGQSDVEWAGDATFVDHMLQMAGGPPLNVHVHFGERVHCADFPGADALLSAVREQMLTYIRSAAPK